jgi:CheY-like chemotaxis protein
LKDLKDGDLKMNDLQPKILVVDDEALIRMSLVEYFQSAGYQVSEAGNGAEAREQFKQQVDGIVSDLDFPSGSEKIEKGGEAFIDEVLAQGFTGTIVVITGRNEAENIVAKHGDRVSVLTKPFSPSAVIEKFSGLTPQPTTPKGGQPKTGSHLLQSRAA